MKHRYTPLLSPLLVLSMAVPVRAQLVYISDPDVRSAYNTWVPGCVDGSGYLDTSLPAVAAYNPVTTSFTDLGSVTIEGLDAFTSVRHIIFFTCGSLVLESLPPQLERLWFFTAGTISWPALPPTLESLYITDSPTLLPPFPEGIQDLVLLNIQAPDMLGTLPSTLLKLTVHNMLALTALPPLPTGLKEMSIGGLDPSVPFPDLTGVDLRLLELWHASFPDVPPVLPASLRNLSLVASTLPEGLSLPAALDSLKLQNITAADFPGFPSALTHLNVLGGNELNGVWWTLQQLPATLQTMELNDCSIDYLPALPASLLELRLVNGSNLTCLPALPTGLLLLVLDQTGITCLPNMPPGCTIQNWGMSPTICSTLSSTCDVVSANVEGQIFRDLDLDGVQDVGEAASNFVHMSIAPIGLAGGVPVNGHFMVQLPIGDYTITCTPNSPFVQGIAPAFHTASLPDGTSTDSGNDFGLDLTTGNDLAVNIVANMARPGFDNAVWINVHNLGTEVTDATVELTFDADQSWVGSDAVPASLVGNVATWILPAMAMGEMRTIQVTLTTASSVPLGTALDHMAGVNVPPGDVDENNNATSYHAEVMSSFDPNDKTVSPSAIDASELATAEFTYTVRFQNTGTYPAERVIISDTLSASLDWNSFRFIASSHTCNWTLFNGVLRFTFEPIYLPDSTSDEHGSHGFVTFTMKPDVSAGLGPIGNVANIYFDYNAPVITNEAVVDISTGIAAEQHHQLRVFPVPAQNVLWVERQESTLAQFVVFDVQGRQMLSMNSSAALVALPVEQLSAGAYVVEVRSDKSTRVPFVKY